MGKTSVLKVILFSTSSILIFTSFTTPKNKKIKLYSEGIRCFNKSKKFHIPIAYSTDNKYVYPTLISITSLLENIKYNKTFYDIYIMINNYFIKKNKEILESVQKRFPEQCKIIFIEMDNMFNEQKGYASTYYRLALHDKLPNINKIIYLDGDTLLFEDLTELINLNMNGYYILGFLDNSINDVEK